MKRITRIGVYGVAIKDDHILLTTKGPNGCYANLLDLPGGGVEFGENAEMTLRREFVEEVGMTFERMQLLDNFSHVQLIDNILNLNEIDNLSHTQHDPGSLHFHHLGQVYELSGVKALENVVAQDEFAWYPLEKLSEEALAPFARAAVAFYKQR